MVVLGLPRWLSGKESTCNAGAGGDVSLIPGLGRSPRGGHGNPLQYSCLENPMEPGGLQSIGSQRVEHDWSDLALTHMHDLYSSRTIFINRCLGRELQHSNIQDIFFLYADLSERPCLYCLSLLWHFYGFGPYSLYLGNSRHVMEGTVMINLDGNMPSPRDVCPFSKGTVSYHTTVPSMNWCWEALLFLHVFMISHSVLVSLLKWEFGNSRQVRILG